MMLGKPYSTVAEAVGEHRLLDALLKRTLDADFRQI
jgi:hypothetical protein